MKNRKRNCHRKERQASEAKLKKNATDGGDTGTVDANQKMKRTMNQLQKKTTRRN